MKDSQECLDEKWFSRFQEYGTLGVVSYLRGDRKYRERQRELFLSGKIINPVFDYPRIDIKILEKSKHILFGLRDDILLKDSNKFIKRAYTKKIEQRMAEISMLEAVGNLELTRQKYVNSNNNLNFSWEKISDEDKEKVARHAKSFYDLSVRVYGKPGQKTFDLLLNSIKRDLGHLAGEFDGLWQSIGKTSQSLFSDSLFEKIQEKVRSELEFNLAGVRVPKKEIYDTNDVKLIVESLFKKHGLTDWQFKLAPKGHSGSQSVDHKNKIIKYPQDKKISHEGLLCFLIHEIFTHVFRRVNGERQILQLLGSGLDSYLQGEEGISKVREQCIKEEAKDKMPDRSRFLAVSLAIGLDSKPRDFRDTFEILKKIILSLNLVRGQTAKEAEKAAVFNSWMMCEKVFRGTTCHLPGICFTKDIVYLQGAIDIWKVLKKNPDSYDQFNLGKYDPANSEHIKILKGLKILK